jgi:hypothetical protein
MVADNIDEVIQGLTELPEVKAGLEAEFVTVSDPILTFEGEDLLAVAEAMNHQFLEWKWSDGLPLVPPTPDRVEHMLKGINRAPQDVIAQLEPGFGVATVEKIAANAVMAGCRPEHLPVIITAVQCISDPRINLRNKAMSTGPHAPMVLVNGPISKDLNINSGACALGPGSISYANTVIGRALRLIMMNVGYTYPGVSDMDTIGSPTKCSLCLAENEAESPWTLFQVEQGFQSNESTGTVHFVYGICELHDFQNYDADKLVHGFASATKNLDQVSTGHWLIGRRSDLRSHTQELEHHFMLICPEHAQLLHQQRWDKDRIRQQMLS